MRKKVTKKTKAPSDIEKAYHKEIIVKPAKRLLKALLKAEEVEMATLVKP